MQDDIQIRLRAGGTFGQDYRQEDIWKGLHTGKTFGQDYMQEDNWIASPYIFQMAKANAKANRIGGVNQQWFLENLNYLALGIALLIFKLAKAKIQENKLKK